MRARVVCRVALAQRTRPGQGFPSAQFPAEAGCEGIDPVAAAPNSKAPGRGGRWPPRLAGRSRHGGRGAWRTSNHRRWPATRIEFALYKCRIPRKFQYETTPILNIVCAKSFFPSPPWRWLLLVAGCSRPGTKTRPRPEQHLRSCPLGRTPPVRGIKRQSSRCRATGYLASSMGFDRSLERTGLGLFEVATFTFPIPTRPIFAIDPLRIPCCSPKDTIAPDPVFPESYKPGLYVGFGCLTRTPTPASAAATWRRGFPAAAFPFSKTDFRNGR